MEKTIDKMILFLLSSMLSLAFAREIPVYNYQIIDEYPHDTLAFTQGLIYKDGFMYEGTGLYGGRSSLRKVVFETGTILKIRHLPDNYFGEGITIYRDTVIQLTWQNCIGLVYVEKDTFELIDTFGYSTEGWGLTHDGNYLIMSDGSNVLHFLDPSTYQEVYQIEVYAEGSPVEDLNELEYIQGKIYANVWYCDSIAIIDPHTGDVTAWLNLTGILGTREPTRDPNVLNGIAFDEDDIRLFVTGKLWPTLFEIDVEPLNYPPEIISYSPSSPCTIEVDSTISLSVSVQDPDPQDSIQFIWSINGEVDTTAHDSMYSYYGAEITVDTVMVEVTDTMYSDSISWVIHVEESGIAIENYTSPKLTSVVWSYPNPFRDRTTIHYNVCHRTKISLEIFDSSGRMVQTLLNDKQDGGRYKIIFDAERLHGGVYFLRATIGDTKKTNKLILLR